jgi:predicted small lipoprotein YifL
MKLAFRIIASFAAFALLAACGLKGPLYLPPPESDTLPAPAKPDTNKPKPAQPSSSPR